MASAATSLDRTDVFAAQNQRMVTDATTIQWADVFSRRERREMGIAIPIPRRLTVRLPIEGGPIEFTYMSFAAGLPQWASPVLQSISERWGAKPGWDSYRALPTNPQLVAKLLNILSDLMRGDFSPPQITPLADGGVQAEWHHGGQDLEIVVPALDDATYYYFNRETNEEEEAALNPNYARAQDLIGRLS